MAEISFQCNTSIASDMDALNIVSDTRDAGKKIIIFAIIDIGEENSEVIGNDIDGHIIKSSELGHILSTIRSTGRSDFPIKLMWGMERGEIAHNTLEALSPREMEVVELVKQGLSNKVIAYNLKLSENTVRNHLSNIMKKLGFRNRVQLATLALREGWCQRGLISPPPKKAPLVTCI